MRKLFFIYLLFLLPSYLVAQKLSENHYWISLKDKAGNDYSLSSPSEFLSLRTLERLARQNISLTEEDLPVSKVYTDSLKNLGLTILGSSRWFNAVIVESTDTLLLDTLDQLSFVGVFNYKIPRKKNIPDIPNFKKTSPSPMNIQFNETEYGYALPQISLVNGDALHKLGYRAADIRIAVIDGGFYRADVFTAFDSLRNEGRLLGYMDFTNAATDFFNTSSHGMSVLSTMAANVPGEIIGTAPQASYYLLKSEIVESESPLEEAFWVLAAEWADSAGANIITSSLGYSDFDGDELDYTYEDMDGKTALCTRAAEKAFSKGMVVVVSAGNQGNKKWKYITAPSDGLNVLAIGSTDTSGIISAFSSRGPTPDNRIKPDVLAVGFRTMVVNSAGLVSPGNGTSFAAPQIAGMIACLWEAAPEKTNLEIVQSVRRSGSFYYNPNDSAGYGIPDFLTALFLLRMEFPANPSNFLTVIPNPNYGSFEVFTDSIFAGEAKISIFNLMGKKVWTGTKTFNRGFARITEMEGQSSGMYFVMAVSDGIEYFSNLVILKR